MLWRWTGYNMVFYLAGLQNIDNQVYEAARIDGAGEFRIFWGILMPGVKPAWMTVILFAVQGYWNMGTGSFIFKEEMKGILKHLFIVIRKDKLSFNYRCNTNSPYTSLRHVYDNKPFDITTNLTNNLPMIYLTPDGEISTQEN